MLSPTIWENRFTPVITRVVWNLLIFSWIYKEWLFWVTPDAGKAILTPAVSFEENNIFGSNSNAILEADLEKKWYHCKMPLRLNQTLLVAAVQQLETPTEAQGKEDCISSSRLPWALQLESLLHLPHCLLFEGYKIPSFALLWACFNSSKAD